MNFHKNNYEQFFVILIELKVDRSVMNEAPEKLKCFS